MLKVVSNLVRISFFAITRDEILVKKACLGIAKSIDCNLLLLLPLKAEKKINKPYLMLSN